MYELIVRHFLACVSQDALGKETTVNIDINGEAVSRALNHYQEVKFTQPVKEPWS